MFNSVNDHVLDLMLADPELKELQGKKISREKIRLILREPAAALDLGVNKGLSASTEVGERISIELETDQMVAWIVLGCPEVGAVPITEAEICRKLEVLQITHGVNTAMINRLVNNPVYNKAFIIARGEDSKDGIDSEIKYYFDMKKELRPVEQENGEINFKEMNFVQAVKKDDLLCEIILGKAGIDGKTVTGEAVKAKGGATCNIPIGRNTLASEDKMRLYAACDGEVAYQNGQIHVDRILYVDNVDLSTGNIRHIGSVHVRGRVCGGFSLKATENITVEDVIENAEVSAGGNVTVGKGIKGKETGIITAGKNICAPFVEHMQLSAGADIYVSVLLNAKVSCKGKIVAQGEKGYILGGSCTAYEVDATQIGNDANIITTIQILGIEEMQVDADDLQSEASLQERAVARLQRHLQDPNNPHKVETQKELLGAIYKKNDANRKLRTLQETMNQLRNEYDFDVKVRETIYPNVIIRMNGIMLRNEESMAGCIFFQMGRKIVARSYNR